MKTRFNLTFAIYLIAILFGIIETVYFLIAFGWHIEAINDAEKICDFIVNFLFFIGTILLVTVILDAVEWVIKKKEDEKPNIQ